MTIEIRKRCLFNKEETKSPESKVRKFDFLGSIPVIDPNIARENWNIQLEWPHSLNTENIQNTAAGILTPNRIGSPLQNEFGNFSTPVGSPVQTAKFKRPDSPLRNENEIGDLFLRNALEIQTENQIVIDGRPISLAFNNNKIGRHSLIAEIRQKQIPIYSDISNQNLLLKVYDRKQILKKKGSCQITKSEVTHALDQYETMLHRGYRVAKIHNLAEARQDCGYILVEKMPSPMPMWDVNAKIEDLTDQQKGLLKQLKDFFAKAYADDIDADYNPDNFFLDHDGNLTLIDFREEALDASELNMTYSIMAQSFGVKDGEIYHEIMPLLKDRRK